MLLRCSCPALSAARAPIAALLTQIAAISGLRAAALNFVSDAAMMAALQLAASVSPQHVRGDTAPAAVPPPALPAAPSRRAMRSVSHAAAADAHRAADAVRRAPQLVCAARVAAAWVSALASDWRRRLGDPTTPILPLTPGLRLACCCRRRVSACAAFVANSCATLMALQLAPVIPRPTCDRAPRSPICLFSLQWENICTCMFR